ncbi:amino acid adenylation domain-containing protein [Streptomyces polygonati]|uniref:Phenyloxazoline synthase MbtB n=1 Tax=Streptomyces polygonati TaxID=1617087 RepID=A0ABV8HUP4_9ACTN
MSGDRPALTPDEVRETVARTLEVSHEELDDDRDLFEQGLDSLSLMSLVGGWRRNGSPVGFSDLVDEPVLKRWIELLCLPRGRQAPPRSGGTMSAAVEPTAPLATMQQAYWIGRQDGQPLGGVAAHFYTELDGEGVDPARLRHALNALAVRHGMLRARFDDEGRQYLAAPRAHTAELVVRDLREASAAEVEATLDQVRERYTHARMDVTAGQVLLVALTLLPAGATRLHIDLDMMAGDALSLRVLLRDLGRLYSDGDESDLPPLTLDYPSYLAAHKDHQAVEHERAAQWWRERLADLPSPPRLPFTVDPLHPISSSDTDLTRSCRLHHWLDGQAKATFIARARSYGVTPAAALATAFAEAVATWSDSRRFLLNLPVFDRELISPDVAELIGDFSSSLLLDADLRQELPFVEQVRRVQDGIRTALAHSAYSGVEVLRDLSRRQGSPVLAPVVYTSAIGLGEIFEQEVQSVLGRPVWIISQGPQVVLDAQVTELDAGLLLNWDVRGGLFAPGVPEAAFAAYRTLVDDLVSSEAAWRSPVGSRLPVAALQRRARAARRDDRLPEEVPQRSLHGRFFALAEEKPGSTAVVGEGGTVLTYGQLALAARRVAGSLSSLEVRPGDTVAVSLPKGVRQLIAVLGVLAAGAAYVPVGLDQPAARREHIHRIAGAAIVLTDDEHAPLVEQIRGARVVRMSETGAAEPAPVREVRPADAAYVIFTSGSTGVPKGVEVPHRAAVSTIDALAGLFSVGPDDATLALSALDFDLSVYDIFAPLSVGGRVVTVREEDRRDAGRWAELMETHRVTVLNCVPALLDLLLAAAATGAAPGQAGDVRLGSLRLALLGGDWVGLDQPARLRALAPGCRFVALGGMTEAAIHSTVCEVGREGVDPAWKSIPYGVPLPGVRARVVDERGHDRPDLVAGELWIGGRALANGYRGDAERTAARFVEHDGERWYRSGDLARYRPDGRLEFLGRADHQVKIRGHRIELGEIEAALRSHPDVLHAVAAVIDAPESTAGRLAVMVSPVAGRGHVLRPDDLVAWAGTRLPSYMLPEHVLVATGLPLNPNGKLDRAAVRELIEADGRHRKTSEGREGAEAPAGPVEKRVAELWSELLRLPAVGRNDSFFALGGDSLVATRMVSRLKAAGVSGAGVGALFATPVLREFAARLTLASAPPAATASPLPLRTEPDPARAHEPFPLTEVQSAYATGRGSGFTLGGVGTWHYSEFDGTDVDLPRLERAWRALVRRHGMLRAVIEDSTQRVLAEVPPFAISVREMAPGEDAEPVLARLRADMSHQIRDPARWPLFDIRAVRYQSDTGEVRTRIGVGLDYIVLDALSIVTLYTEWGILYGSPDDDRDPLPELDLTFRDYQAALAARTVADPEAAAETKAHWSSRLDSLPPAPRLPYRVDPAEVDLPRFTRRRTVLDTGSWRAIKARAVRNGLTASTVLLAAYGETLTAWSGTDAVSVTLTLFNRHEIHPHVLHVVGDFTSLSLAGYQRADGPWLPTLHALQGRQAQDLDHQDVPASWLLRELARRTATLQTAAPVVFTSALGVGDASLADRSRRFPARVWGVTQSPQVCLDHQVTEENGELVITWDAVEELFHDGVLDAMVDAHSRLLHHLAEGDWNTPVPELLPPGQRVRRERLNDSRPARPRLLHAGFFERAAEEPGAVALIAADGRTLTYGQTADAALRTGAALRQRGVVDGDPVAVTLPKGPEQVVAALGVLAAGAAYVPLGVEQPEARRARILRAADIRLTIGEGDGTGPGGVLTPAEALAAAPLDAPRQVPTGSVAYTIYTSGSTGEPKGVRISHAAAWNTVADINQRHRIGPADRVLALSALDFDLSVYDIFGLLAAGGALVLPSEEQRREPGSWRALIREHGVSVWNTVPALLDLLLDADERDGIGPVGTSLAGLRAALVSGDWIGLDLPGRLHERTGGRCRFTAMGGATEASIWSNAYDATASAPEPGWTSVPYGFPLTGQRYRVADSAGRDCPDWVAGELWIGGAGLADGYLGDLDRTAAKFVTHGGRRWYRTGDLGRYRPGGILEFLGRTDAQLKIAGHRIEAGEVETAVKAHPSVARAAVVATGPRTARRLEAFVVLDGEALAQRGDHMPVPGSDGWLRSWLTDRLAPYAQPTSVHVLPSLPLTANGKIDRPALAVLAENATPSAPGTERPDGAVETRIADLWNALLPGPVSDRHVNFFAAGGDSLAAIRLVGAIERSLGARVDVRTVLAAPTIAALGAEVAAALAAEDFETETGEL